MPEDAERPPSQIQTPKGRWRQADVKRAITAAEQAGLGCYRIEIAHDGTISIVVDAQSKASADF
jgi:hypothetical protein